MKYGRIMPVHVLWHTWNNYVMQAYDDKWHTIHEFALWIEAEAEWGGGSLSVSPWTLLIMQQFNARYTAQLQLKGEHYRLCGAMAMVYAHNAANAMASNYISEEILENALAMSFIVSSARRHPSQRWKTATYIWKLSGVNTNNHQCVGVHITKQKLNIFHV